jgi:vitamin B12 transporter
VINQGYQQMNKSIIASLVGAYAASLAFSTPAFSADETIITTDDVIVTASRIPQTRESVIADVSVINSEEIQRAGQSSLVELLQTQPGIEITNNGGVGKQSGIFMRGTNTSHALVLIDGMRISSATAGTTTFENLPLNQIDKIEILRGPATSLYGQDAIGGVIQIFTKKGTEKTQYYANAGIGTYNTRIGEAGVRGQLNKLSYAANISAQDTDGFSALDTNNPNLKDDDGYRNLAFNGNLAYKIIEGHEIGIQLFNSDGDTDFDNRFNFTDFSSKAKLNQQAASVYAKNQFTNIWLSTVKVGFSQDKLKSYDELGAPGFDRFDTKQQQLNWQNDISLPIGTLTLMYDRLSEKVTSDTVYNKTQRLNEGYVASFLTNFNAHSLQLSYRDDHNTSFGNQHTGGVGYGYTFNEYWRATASYGSAFKAPTFNDLYFPDFFGFPTSNPNLKPEKSDNVEASLRYQDNSTSASLVVYENKVRNLIALDSLTFVPFNVNKATLTGMTLSAAQQLGNWNLSGSVDVQSPRDDDTDNLLVRRANRHASANVNYRLNDWRFGLEGISSSKRYNDANNDLSIAGYTIFNLTADYQINKAWKVQSRLNNVFDKDYALAYDGNPNTTGFIYNTSGSNLFVSVRWQSE